MANLNPHDIVFLDSLEFKGFKEKIESQYGFEIISTDLPKIISFTSKKLVLHTSKGDFFLKEKPQYCSDGVALKRSADFQDYTSLRLKIVPKILLTTEQNHYIVWNGRYYFLTEYKNGRHYNGLQSDLKEITEALYLFQQCGITYLKEYKNVRQKELTQFESLDIASSIPDLKSRVKTSDDEDVLQEIILLYDNLCNEYAKIPKDNYIM